MAESQPLDVAGRAPVIRVAEAGDVPGMQRVRGVVRENRLVSRTISDAEVLDAIERVGRGWVALVDGEVVGFAIGERDSGRIWALFVDPAHEGHGLGRQLHDAMVDWLFAQGLQRLSLVTEGGTRAERFYRRAGWQFLGPSSKTEVHFRLDAADRGAPR